MRIKIQNFPRIAFALCHEPELAEEEIRDVAIIPLEVLLPTSPPDLIRRNPGLFGVIRGVRFGFGVFLAFGIIVIGIVFGVVIFILKPFKGYL